MKLNAAKVWHGVKIKSSGLETDRDIVSDLEGVHNEIMSEILV